MQKTSSWKDTLRFIIVALVIIIPIRLFIAEPFMVSGPSMNPTFRDGEYLIVNRLAYKLGDPKRGDVVVFKYPQNPSVYYIKRIIGLPGETVIINNGKPTIKQADGTELLLDESYIVNKDTSTATIGPLGPSQYAVLGDNRPVSSDSRYWGSVDRSLLIGTPMLSLWPVDLIGINPGDHQFSK